MVKIAIYIDVDLDPLPYFAEEVISKSIALKAARGNLFDSNFDLPISQVNNWKIESGFIRRRPQHEC